MPSEASATERLSVGVIGGGVLAQRVHLPNLAAMDDRFHVAALADPSPTVRATLGERYGIPALHVDAESLLAQPGLDAVLVTSPNAAHAHAVLGALRAGLHVFVEKPICIALRDADHILTEQARAGTVVQVGYMKRFDRGYEQLLEAVARDGEAPRLVHVITREPPAGGATDLADVAVADDVPAELGEQLRRWTRTQMVSAAGTKGARATFAFSEVYLGSVIHDLNLAAGVLEAAGDALTGHGAFGASWAAGKGAHVTIPTEQGGRVVLTWIEAGGGFRETLTAIGERATHELTFRAPFLDPPDTSYRVSRDGGPLAAPPEPAGPASDPFRAELEHFHACVRGREACRAPALDARRDIAVLTSAFAAALHGFGTWETSLAAHSWD